MRHADGLRMPVRRMLPLGAAAIVCLCACLCRAQQDGPRHRNGGANELLKPDNSQRGRNQNDPHNSIFRTAVPDHPFDVILSRPTRDSITASVLFYDDADVRIVYGLRSGVYAVQTPLLHLKKDEPSHVRIGALKPDTRYFYRVEYRKPAAMQFARSDEFTFHTARPAGGEFIFTVQADSHLDYSSIPQIYSKTLANALADKPDFHVDLGDTFMTDKYPKYTDAKPQYVAQRYYFGLLCHSAPLFFVLSNHDGEAGWRRQGGRDNDGSALWSNQIRRRYYANPFPDGFYTGNSQPDAEAGRLENYYAWHWGDALFIVLDPFWYTMSKIRPNEGNWNRTLGRAQYDWLKLTLESSKARFKFVFLHHLVGGFDKEGRGGVEAAKYWEWGGCSIDGQNDFASRRPGWAAPIHDLLTKNHVTAVFHGHDHLYVRQQLDGVVYLEVPQPSHPENNVARSAADYGYTHGVILGSPGHIRIRVSPASTTIEYVRSRQATEESQNRRNGEVADSVTIR